MFSKLRLVWLVAGRELKDQFRDWRVLAPMIILVLCFPVLMNEFAKQTVDFLNQYDANLILDRFVPFSIMIIGFFPITISLVVALESFVGEKERGTIEPILSAPLDDWQLYFGKLLVGVATPLVASYLSIAACILLMVSRQDLEDAVSHGDGAIVSADHGTCHFDGQRGDCDLGAVHFGESREFAGILHRYSCCHFDAGRGGDAFLGK